MKNWLIALLLLGSLFSGPCQGSPGTIVLVADEWPPFNTLPSGSQQGYIVDIAREVFEPLGYTIDYRIVPWTRALEMTRSGMANGAVGASKTDAAGFVFPTEELARNTLAFYVKKGNPWRFSGPESIAEITLGTIAGYDYRPWLLQYIEENSKDPAKVQVIYGDDPLKRNLIKLLGDRIGVVVDTEAAIRHVAREMKILNQIECAGYGNEPAYIYIAFSPNRSDSQQLAQLLSEGITRLRESGRLAQILAMYGLVDWK